MTEASGHSIGQIDHQAGLSCFFQHSFGNGQRIFSNASGNNLSASRERLKLRQLGIKALFRFPEREDDVYSGSVRFD